MAQSRNSRQRGGAFRNVYYLIAGIVAFYYLRRAVQRLSYAVPTDNFEGRKPMPIPPGRQQILTVVAPIKPGQAEAATALLNEISANYANNPYIDFSKLRSIHFARWLPIYDADNGHRLVFSCTYNGKLEDMVADLAAASPGLDAIWGHCTEYTGRDTFLAFIKGSTHEIAYRFFAFPNESAQSIRDKILLRRQLEAMAADRPDLPAIQTFLESLYRTSHVTFFTAIEKIVGYVSKQIIAAARFGMNNFGDVVATFFANWGMQPYVPIPYSPVTDPETRKAQIQHIIELDRTESHFAQNQFTVMVEIRPERYFRMRFLMFLGAFITDNGYPAGSLIGVFTIHSLYWTMIDNGKRAILMTNYDGNWSSYLGDFARISTLLDSLLNNVKGYPPAGLKQVNLFNEWIRGAQLVCPLYYSAYPQETVLNIIRDREVTKLLGQEMEYNNVERLLELL
ncbi:MAG: hypothetical protein ACOYL5_16805 [Phototrophicaceae bacterium]|jgi:hypothetical protein